MFNNCDSKTNGEYQFYLKIRNRLQIIFDVGCRANSEFLSFIGEVHYFDPVENFIKDLSSQNNSNEISYFNNFGLVNENKEIYYYPAYESFFDRIKSCKNSDDANKVLLKIKKGKDYIIEKNIQSIDFLKIDTEGYELNVLKGFEDFLHNVKIIQFEYGGTFLDNNVKLIDVINYLKQFGFNNFYYLSPNGIKLINDYTDHYMYCNIVTINTNSNIHIF
jgi:FkbM family methyltransferase